MDTTIDTYCSFLDDCLLSWTTDSRLKRKISQCIWDTAQRTTRKEDMRAQLKY